MKKMWTIIEAIKTLEGEFDPETNVVKVPFPLNGLRKCGAFDFFENSFPYSCNNNYKIINLKERT